jgi:hypothetical protein
MIKLGYEPEKEYLQEMKCSYLQPSDTSAQSHSDNQIDIHLEDSGAGHYMVIETTRWAFDDVADITKIIEDFRRRAGL